MVLAFIAAVAAAGIYFARRPTIAKGSVIAADILVQKKAWKTLECDDFDIHVGGKFECRVELVDGDKARLAMTLTEQGSYLINPLEITHPEHGDVPPKADPWE